MILKEYYRLLNTHDAYYKFRKYRNYTLMNDKPINPKVAIQTMIDIVRHQITLIELLR